jgi:curli biogenesis system outer membrane secretion channel CsgG
MTMKNFLQVLSVAFAMMIGATVMGQDAPQGKMRIGLGAVKILPALKQALTASGQLDQVNRAAETIEAQMMDALQNTRKFEIVARHDLDELIREQGLPAGAVTDPSDAKSALAGRIKGVEYLILTTIDDFVDIEQSTASQEMQMAMSRRTVRMSAVVRIYNSSTGVLSESMSVPVQVENTGATRMTAGDAAKNPKAQDDSIYVELVNQLSMRCAQRTTDILFPAKVVTVTGDSIVVNRGAGTMINRSEVWEVFAAGKDLRDPDTGEVLGKEETKMGEIVIMDVLPKSSRAQIVGENRGIAPGQIARQKLQMPQAPPPATAK